MTQTEEDEMTVNPQRLEQLREVYATTLKAYYEKHPAQYVTTMPAAMVVDRMCSAIAAKGIRAVNIGPALAAALKKLKVKATYTAVETWLSGKEG